MTSNTKSFFHLEKWYLDFVSDTHDVMIFYAARLKWYGYAVTYTSWLMANDKDQPNLRQYFRHVQMPVLDDKKIAWSEKRFEVSGTWTSRSDEIHARLIDMPEGFLDWNCFQPSSEVTLDIEGKIVKGTGYAEQLILTVPPWKIPMETLRWGRFLTSGDSYVWIQVKMMEGMKQWLWCNSELTSTMKIDDEIIDVPGQFQFSLKPLIILESEKKINRVVNKIIRYIPGFNKVIPIRFLMADEYKWFSEGELSKMGNKEKGTAIHEFVNFQLEK